MYTFVKRLQRKSDSQKRAILVALTAVSAIAIGGLWLFTLQTKLSNEAAFLGPSPKQKEASNEESRVSIDVEGPFKSLKDTTLNSFAAIKSQFDELKNTMPEDVSPTQEVSNEGEAWELPVNTQ